MISLVPFVVSISVYADFKPLKFSSEKQEATVHQVTEGFDKIWGFDFFPDGQSMIFTERSGKMHVLNLKTKKHNEVKGVPKSKEYGQGGLMDVRFDPQYSTNKTMYFTYSAEYNDGVGTIVAKSTLEKGQLKNTQTIFQSNPPGYKSVHFGSRIVFGPNNTMFFGVGDRGQRDLAQDLSKPNGKLFRIYRDGKIPEDNPFVGKKGAIKSIWSYGHRNPQGMFIHPESGELYEQEHGPRGGDEINHIKPGKNYGWPKVTYGKEYWGPSIGPSEGKGYEQPIKHYTPSIAPGSLMIYSGKKFKKWKGDFFSAALKFEQIHRLVVKDNKAVKDEVILKDFDHRIRHIAEHPSGEIYFSTDSGKIFVIR